jgi:hypothetical protein
MIMEAQPTQYAVIMEAHDQVVSELEAHRTGDCTGIRELPSMLWRPIIKPSSSWRRTSFAGARRPATGFTFPYQGDGDGRHQNAPADGRRHAQMYVTGLPSRIKEMVTVVTKMRLLTVAGMRKCMLPSSCPTVVGSWNRKYPFRICVNFR